MNQINMLQMWRLVLISGLLCWTCEAIRVSCKDEKNQDVDWYIIYKKPASLGYIFINPKGEVKKMTSINNRNGALANTLNPILRSIRTMEPSFGFISYSDQPPGSSADVNMFGHSKGVLMMDRTSTGVWLSHSTPQFPYRRDRGDFWPPSGFQNGQIFLCATFKYNEFKDIGKHLQYIGAFPYEHDIPNNFHQELKDAVQWTQLPPPTSNFPTLTSDKGTTFKAIPKQKSDDAEVGDLYLSIAKDVSSDMLVQVWGRQQDDSHCEAGKSVLNIETIKTALGQWEPANDHSKWCVAKDQNKNWVCIGDMNRCISQYERKGGALCVNSEKMQQKFLSFAKMYDTCPAKKRPRPCDWDNLATSRSAFIMPNFDPDLQNETDIGVIVDYDSEFLNETETDTHMDPSVMG